MQAAGKGVSAVHVESALPAAVSQITPPGTAVTRYFTIHGRMVNSTLAREPLGPF